jgi:hypothetical protein
VTALGVVDEAGLTQTGHVRQNNEDSYLIRGDLFMIADGMAAPPRERWPPPCALRRAPRST